MCGGNAKHHGAMGLMQERVVVMPYFPLFISLAEKPVTVFGGGAIATRRIEKLLPFGCAITVIAPTGTNTLHSLAEQGALRWLQRGYQAGDCDGAFLVLAATNDPAVNQAVCREAAERGIPVNAADNKAHCDFYFPGLVVTDDLVIGVTANGNHHGLVKQTVQQLQQLWKEESPDETTQ